MKKYLVSFFFLFSLCFSNIDYNINYLMKFSNGENASTNIFENYYDVSIYHNNYYFYTLLKYGEPLMGKSTKSLTDLFRIGYMEYTGENIKVTVGDLFMLYGRGLSLHTYEDRDIDYNNGITGLNFTYFFKNGIELYGLIGNSDFKTRSNPADLQSNIKITNDLTSFGLSIYKDYFDLYYSMHINNQVIDSTTIVEMSNFGSYLGDYITNTLKISNEHTFNEYEMTNFEHNIGTNLYFNNLEISFEYSSVFYDKIHGDRTSGYRGYFSTYFNIFDVGFLYEYKDYNTPYLYSVFSNPPTVFKEASSPLISRHLHSIDFNNEVGHQLVINKSFSEQLNLNMNYAFAHKHMLEDSIEPSISEIFSNMFSCSDLEEFSSLLPYRQLHLEFNGWSKNEKIFYKIGFDVYDEYINTDSPSTLEEDSLIFLNPNKILNAQTLSSQFSYVMKNRNSISTYLEFQNLENQLTSDKTSSIFFNPSFNYKGKAMISLFYDFEETEYADNSWVGMDFAYYISDTDMVSLFLGSQKGGLVCANGTCVQQPDFDNGVKVTLRTMF